MEHRHDFADAAPVGRCRVCTANDTDAVIERLAEDLWESRRNGHLDDFPWAECGPYWQGAFRELATAAVESLRAPS